MDQNLWMIHKIFFIFFVMFAISDQITAFNFFLGGPLKFMLVSQKFLTFFLELGTMLDIDKGKFEPASSKKSGV